jgi:polysaccharide pyruvyl transferase WcaK-like protein
MKVAIVSNCAGVNDGDAILSECLSLVVAKGRLDAIPVYNLLDGMKSGEAKKAKIAIGRKGVPKWAVFLRKFKHVLRSLLYRRRLIDTLAGYDFVIIGGGNLLYDLKGTPFLQYCRLISSARPRRCSLVSVGAGPITERSYKVVNDIVKNTDQCLLRDMDSLRLVENIVGTPRGAERIGLFPDPGFCVSRYYPRHNDVRSDILGVNVMPLQILGGRNVHMGAAEVAAKIVKLATELKCSVRMICSSRMDTEFSHNVISEMHAQGLSDIEFVESICASTIGRAYSNLRYMISVRMHPGIFAISYGIPTVVIPWQQKLTGVMNEALGDDGRLILLSGVDYDPQEAVEKLMEQERSEVLIQAMESLIKRIDSCSDELVARMKECTGK